MPNSVSAKKRLRQNLSRRTRNRAARASIRTQIRKVRTAIAGGDPAACEAEFRVAVKKLDQAAGKNIVHANSVARIKSRLSKAIKAVKDKGGAPAKAK
jgi:small subunit ribosomal protein S20